MATYDFLADDGLDYKKKLANYATDKTAASNEYNRANQVYNYKTSIGDTAGATAANKWLGEVNTAAGGTLNRANNDTYNAINKYSSLADQAPTQFNYNVADDPQYQNAMQQALLGASRATNNATTALGSRGIGNSSIAVDRANQINQSAVSDVNSNLLPSLITQAYTRFLGDRETKQQQMNNYSTLAGMTDSQYQNDLNNKIVESGVTGMYNGSPTQAAQNQSFNQGVTQAGLTGTYNPYAGLISQMNTNSQNWFNSDPSQQQSLAAENQRIGAQIGATQDAEGNWIMPQAIPTLDALKTQFANDQYWNTFQENVRQFDTSTAIDRAYKDGQLTLQQAAQAINQYEAQTGRINAGTSSYNAQTNADQLAWAKDPNNPDNIYKTAQANASNAKSTVTAKDSADNYSVIKEDVDSGISKAKARELLQANRGSLSDADYNKMSDYIDKNLD